MWLIIESTEWIWPANTSTSLCFVDSEEKTNYASELTQAGQLIRTHKASPVPYTEECLWGVLTPIPTALYLSLQKDMGVNNVGNPDI